MDAPLQSFIGIGISIILFLIGYRQTVGAKKERVRAANTDIEKTLLRRTVLEAYKPTVPDIVRLIEGKARDHRVRIADLLSPSQFLVTLFTRIVESDFVTSDQRETILERINPVLETLESKPPEIELIIAKPTKGKELVRALGLISLGVFASLVGTLVASLTILQENDTISAYSPTVIMVFSISIIAIVIIIFLQKIRESQEDAKQPVSPIQAGVQFEQEVAKLVSSFGYPLKAPATNRGNYFDFLLEIGDRKLIIETKAWSSRPPLPHIRKIAQRLQNAIKNYEATEAILLIKDDTGIPLKYFENLNIKIMTLKSFKIYLKKLIRK